ncbi:uncharacterized protein [Macrobrachium rosenbergii]|uniref:uncharacterized protein n=1 Tax=Macrobrachium rosenbergii TaxID=79674 RepID=UPI0034D693BF
MLAPVQTTSSCASSSLATAQSFTIATMNQLCKVCGEPAAGFHFGAFTCEGCKSFFGRTYNNLSQVHECKNGGQCVINKQNRTSCKACRLRKCLMVGMSKTGSRYGRRSNWFKIHCLLQEQANYNGVPQNIRTPITPTLQDGSLPFVSAHLRDTIGRDGPIRAPPPLPPPPPELHSQDIQTSLSGLSSTSQINAQVERRIQEESLKALTRSLRHQATSQDLETLQVLEVIRRSQNLENLRTSDFDALRRSVDLDPIRRSHEFEAIDSLRQIAPEFHARLGPLAVQEWERRLREASRHMESDAKLERKEHLSLELKNDHRPQECKPDSASGAKSVDSCDQEVVSTVKEEPIKIDYELTKVPMSIGEDTEKARRSSPPKFHDKKSTGVLMSEEERLSFLKAVNNQSNSVYAQDHAPVSSPARMPPNADLIYSSLNNNIFPFPPYPPLWPSMLHFPHFANKFYPSPATSFQQTNIDIFKKSIFNPTEPTGSRASHRMTKDDAVNKKRFLDAVLQVQRQSLSPQGPSPTGRTPQPHHSASPSASPSVTPTTTQATLHDQPMDLTVRRKRKMDKSEIIYNPGEDLSVEEQIESEDDKEEKWLKREDVAEEDEDEAIEEVVEGPDEDEDEEMPKNDELTEPESEVNSEVPLKLIKLDSPGETLVA